MLSSGPTWKHINPNAQAVTGVIAIFQQLDKRNEELVWIDEDLVKKLEDKFATKAKIPEFKIMEVSDNPPVELRQNEGVTQSWHGGFLFPSMLLSVWDLTFVGVLSFPYALFSAVTQLNSHPEYFSPSYLPRAEGGWVSPSILSGYQIFLYASLHTFRSDGHSIILYCAVKCLKNGACSRKRNGFKCSRRRNASSTISTI